MTQEISAKKRVLVIGAGHCAYLVVNDIKARDLHYEIIGLVDDNSKLWGEVLEGFPILGPTEKIPVIAKERNADELLIAMPSITGEPLQRIIKLCRQTEKPIRIFPAVFDAIHYIDEMLLPQGEKSHINILAGKARGIIFEDFIKRSPPCLEIEKIKEAVEKSVILITGAAGSIGSSIARELIRINPKKLVLLDINEYGIFKLMQEINKPNVDIILGDIRNEAKLQTLFEMYHPNIVIHAAAYKHVPILEKHPEEAVLTNVFGTCNVLNLSSMYHVKKCVLISTDKAVNPLGVMGATKRLAELMVHNMPRNETVYSIVRFGNVIGSSGSLFPIWRKQIKTGKLDITHPKMTRYFMTIQEAALLTLQTLVMKGVIENAHNLFVFDMGKQHNILELATLFIECYNPEADNEIKFNFIGIRPGEKLREALFYNDEEYTKTYNDRIYAVRSKRELRDQNFFIKIENLRQILQSYNKKELIGALQKLVPEYKQIVQNVMQNS